MAYSYTVTREDFEKSNNHHIQGLVRNNYIAVSDIGAGGSSLTAEELAQFRQEIKENRRKKTHGPIFTFDTSDVITSVNCPLLEHVIGKRKDELTSEDLSDEVLTNVLQVEAGLKQLRTEMTRKISFNHRQLIVYDSDTSGIIVSVSNPILNHLIGKHKGDVTSEDLSDEILLRLVRSEFSGEIEGESAAILLIKRLTQVPFYYTKTTFMQAGIYTEKESEKNPGAYSLKLIDQVVDVYQTEPGKIYQEISTKGMKVQSVESDSQKSFEHLSATLKGSSWSYQLRQPGFVEHKTVLHDPKLYDMLMGIAPKPASKDESIITWFDPSLVFLRTRLHQAYQDTFDVDTTDKTKRVEPAKRLNIAGLVGNEGTAGSERIAAFLGLPRKDKNYKFNMVGYVCGGFILSPLLNLGKFFLEFLPRAVDASAGYAVDRLREREANNAQADAQAKAKADTEAKIDATTEVAIKADSKLLRLGIRFAIGALRAIQGLSFLTYTLTRRLTSPIRAFEDAWKIHPVLGIASAVVSLGLIVLTAKFAAPLLLSKGLAVVTNALGQVPGFSQVGSYIANGLSKLGSAVGVGVQAVVAALALEFSFGTMLKGMAKKLFSSKDVSKKVESDKDSAKINLKNHIITVKSPHGCATKDILTILPQNQNQVMSGASAEVQNVPSQPKEARKEVVIVAESKQPLVTPTSPNGISPNRELESKYNDVKETGLQQNTDNNQPIKLNTPTPSPWMQHIMNLSSNSSTASTMRP